MVGLGKEGRVEVLSIGCFLTVSRYLDGKKGFGGATDRDN